MALDRRRLLTGAARAATEAAFLHYRWSGLYMSLFFAAEGAYYEGVSPMDTAA